PPRDAALAPDAAAPHLAEPMRDEALAPEPLQERDGAAPDVAAGACPFAFCEDFEGVVIGMPPDPRVWTRAGNILVEAAPGGRPGRAMHVRAGMTPTETYISQTKTLPALGDAFYARVRMYLASRPTDFF